MLNSSLSLPFLGRLPDLAKMSSQFDEVHDRKNTDSQKWQKYEGKDILPMWVADMDFQAPQPVLEALHERVDHGIFGYARPERSATEAVIEMLENNYQWRVKAEWLVWLPGLVVGLNVTSRAFASTDETILTTTPIYPPFLLAPRFQNRGVIKAPMALDGRTWVFDWDAMDNAVEPNTRMFFFCNPHNPCSRVFEKEELERVTAFCEKHDLLLCSDEIHCELLLDGREHVSISTLSKEIEQRCLTLISPSKTYNLAGLGCSLAIIPNDQLRRQFAASVRGIVAEVNNFGYVACEAAYRHGAQWRDELLDYLKANRDLVQSFVQEKMPLIGQYEHQATYLAWMDMQKLQLDNPGRHFEERGVGLSEGSFFDAPNHLRLNFGCPRSTLQEGLKRMKNAYDAATN